MDRQAKEHKDKWTNGQINRKTNGQTDKLTERQMDRWTKEQKYRRTDRDMQIDVHTNGQMSMLMNCFLQMGGQKNG